MSLNVGYYIPRPTLAIGSIGILGAVSATAYFLGLNTQALLALLAGVLLVCLLILLAILFMRWRLRKQYGEGDMSLMEVVRGRPAGVSDPEQVARLDQFARKFEEGCRKYVEATGMAVSESPWYLLVGESGSGKTEAIRHSGVEFPEGLQEERQGAGGTTNMDWWFTEQAIILDTAGRFAIDPNGARTFDSGSSAWRDPDEEEEQSSAASDRERKARQSTSREWELFLQSVVKARPFCPINGLLLVIPATSLLKDTPDEINAKAEELSRFLTGVRQGLGVRFPVFVLVTKSDLIPGFREYFGTITNAELSQQMLGWSKLGSLDEPFDPEEIDDYLEDIRRRLERRRLSLIADPIHSQLPGARRIEQVDALYTFPQRFSELGPQLRRYLGKMFVRSKFNQAPLFLRGIYFTSSMEQGAAIDAVLASLRGVSLKQLERQGIGYRRDRAVFLRDVFMRKVFEESGLVTRETRTDFIKRRRQIKTMGITSAAAALLIGFAVIGWRTIMRNLDQSTRDWSAVSAQYQPQQWDFLTPPERRTPLAAAMPKQWDKASGVNGSQTIAAFLTKERDPGESTIRTPWIYAPVSALLFNPESQRKATVAALIDRHLLQNVIDVAQTRAKTIDSTIARGEADQLDATLFRPDAPMTQTAVALQSLAKIAATGKGTPPNLGPILDLDLRALDGNTAPPPSSIDAHHWLDDATHASDAVDRLHDLGVTPEQANAAALAVSKFWATRLDASAAQRRLPPLKVLRDALHKWDGVFKKLCEESVPRSEESLEDFQLRAQDIAQNVKILKDHAAEADGAWTQLCEQAKTNDPTVMLDWLSQQLIGDRDAAIAAINQVKTATDAPETQSRLNSAIDQIRQRHFAAAEMLAEGGLSGTDARLRTVSLRSNSAVSQPLYRQTTDLILIAAAPIDEQGNEAFATQSLNSKLTAVRDGGTKIGHVLGDAAWTVTPPPDQATAPPLIFGSVHPAVALYQNVSAPLARYRLIESWLNQAPKNSNEFASRVHAAAVQAPVPQIAIPLSIDSPPTPGAPLSGWDSAADFAPIPASTMLADWVAVRDLLNPPPTTMPASAGDPMAATPQIPNLSSFQQSALPIHDAATKYADAFATFWYSKRPTIGKWPTWSGDAGLRGFLIAAKPAEVITQANARTDQCISALKSAVAALEPASALDVNNKIAALNAARSSPDDVHIVEQWASLPPNAMEAVATLTGGDPNQIYHDYFAPVVGREDEFHRQLVLAASQTMVDEAKNIRDSKYDHISSVWLTRFPFNSTLVTSKFSPQGKPVNPLKQMSDMKAALTDLDAATSGSKAASPAAAASAVPDLSFVKNDELVKTAISKLYSSASGVERLLAAKALTTDLIDPNVTCDLTFLESSDATAQFIQFTERSVRIGAPRIPPVVKSLDEAKKTPFNMTVGGSTMDIKFSAFATQGFASIADDPNPNPWKLLELLARANYEVKPGETWWPAAGREISALMPDMKTTLKFKVVFKQNGKPIPFPYPLPGEKQ